MGKGGKSRGVRDRSCTALSEPCFVDVTLDHVNVSHNYLKKVPKNRKQNGTHEPF